MIYLLPDTAAQTIYLSLDEGRQYFTETFTHYLIIITRFENNSSGGLSIAQVATVTSENSRYTTLSITTIGLESKGRHKFVVYGQNSSGNLDPLNADVVGVVETGMIELSDSANHFLPSQSNIPNDIRSTQ